MRLLGVCVLTLRAVSVCAHILLILVLFIRKKKCYEYKRQGSIILDRLIGSGGLADKKGVLGDTANELAVSLELFTSKSFPT